MINHATPYVLPEGKDILSEEAINAIPENIYDGDDPWIATSINTDLLIGGQKLNESGEIVGEYDQADNSGISIHHSFHPVLNSKTAHDKNKTSDWYSDESESNEFLQENKLPITNRETENDDTIKLYTPYVDATGHVVGKNIETITLPYGYKYFKTDGLSPKDAEGKDIVDDLYSTVNYTSTEDTKTIGDIANNSVAHNTQDILTINPHNKWIQTKLVDTENDGDVLTIAHEIHSIDETVSE